MNVANLSTAKELDEEWVELIAAARSMEIGIDEVRAFLNRPSQMATHLVNLITADHEITSQKALS